MILGKNEFQINFAVLKILNLFESLGLTVNKKASILHPVRVITYLVIKFDLSNKTMQLSKKIFIIFNIKYCK